MNENIQTAKTQTDPIGQVEAEVGKPKPKKLFGGGYRKPIKDENGLEWCNCAIPNLVSNMGIGRGVADCLRCGRPYYH